MNDLPPISNEQLNIVNHILNGDNVVVNAVAGSGKVFIFIYLYIL